MTAFLFVHGWATDNAVWDSAVTALGPDVCLNINLPSHGAASRWDRPDFTPGVGEIRAALSGLSLKSVVAVGWSLGAQVLLSAIKEGVGFKGVVLVGATPRFTNTDGWQFGQSKALVRRMIQDMKKTPDETLRRFYELNFTPEELKKAEAGAFVNRYKFPGPIECTEGGKGRLPGCFPKFDYEGITNALCALYEVDLRNALSLVKVPCLVLHGDKDAICSVEVGKYLAANIHGARLEIFKDAGHAPFLTKKDEFIKTIVDFSDTLS